MASFNIAADSLIREIANLRIPFMISLRGQFRKIVDGKDAIVDSRRQPDRSEHRNNPAEGDLSKRRLRAVARPVYQYTPPASYAAASRLRPLDSDPARAQRHVRLCHQAGFDGRDAPRGGSLQWQVKVQALRSTRDIF